MRGLTIVSFLVVAASDVHVQALRSKGSNAPYDAVAWCNNSRASKKPETGASPNKDMPAIHVRQVDSDKGKRTEERIACDWRTTKKMAYLCCLACANPGALRSSQKSQKLPEAGLMLIGNRVVDTNRMAYNHMYYKSDKLLALESRVRALEATNPGTELHLDSVRERNKLRDEERRNNCLPRQDLEYWLSAGHKGLYGKYKPPPNTKEPMATRKERRDFSEQVKENPSTQRLRGIGQQISSLDSPNSKAEYWATTTSQESLRPP